MEEKIIDSDLYKTKSINVFVSIVILLLVVSLSFVYYQKYSVKKRNQMNIEAYKKSLLNEDPKELQALFIEDVKGGVNDSNTKSAAYFLAHRYFDNGGNVYEMVDYVEAHPELAFFREGAKIYPNLFKRIKERKIPSTYSDAGMYATLAGLEVLDNHGYADIASLATLANQYAKLGYFLSVVTAENPSGVDTPNRLKQIPLDIKKSVHFGEKTKVQVTNFFTNSEDMADVPAQSILVGLNQYAATLRYYEMLGIKFDSPKTSKEIFDYAINYSARNVPELYAFTSFLDASTLSMLKESTDEQVLQALTPFLKFNNAFTKTQSSKVDGLVDKILRSRLENPASPEDVNLDIYGKRNVVMLAKRVPEFKAWLVANYWKEGDFTFVAAGSENVKK